MNSSLDNVCELAGSVSSQRYYVEGKPILNAETYIKCDIMFNKILVKDETGRINNNGK